VCPGLDPDGNCLASPQARRTEPAPRTWRAGEGGWWRYEVLLDGARVERALRADVESGTVEIAAASERGIVLLSSKAELATEVREGRVEIRERRRAA